MSDLINNNPLLSQESQEFPDFSQITVEHFKPALDYAINHTREAIEYISNNPEQATFDNTLVPLELAFTQLHSVVSIFYHLHAVDTNETLDELAEKYAPILSDLSSSIYLNDKLFFRIAYLEDNAENLQLQPDARRLLSETYKDFHSQGVQLNDVDKTLLKTIDSELAQLSTVMQKLCTKSLHQAGVLVDTRQELAGLSETEITAAQEQAQSRSLEGFWLSIVYPSQPPQLAILDNADLRQKLLTISLARNSDGSNLDTTQLIYTIAKLRLRRAQLLGFPSHAHTVIDRNTAPSVEAVTQQLHSLANLAVHSAKKELEEIQKYAIKFTDKPIAASDWQYYAEKLRADHYSVNGTEIAQYFPLLKAIEDGIFFAANKLYGVEFIPRPDLPKYHPDIHIWQVNDTSGNQIGIFLADLYARPSKRGGAWMNTLRDQAELTQTLPVVCNTLNITKPAQGEAYITLDEVETLFHEFGHGLHALLSQVHYPSQSGTNVPRDFVEFPSQVNEMWALWPEVLANYSQHSVTKERMPSELSAAIKTAALFGEGFATTEYLAAAIIDWAYHTITDESELNISWEQFEHNALARANLDLSLIPPRYRGPYFQHIFAGGYAAGYYGYIWSEILDAHVSKWFSENGGLTSDNGARLADAILRTGGSVDPLKAYEKITGSPASIEALLQRRGLLTQV